MAPPQPEERQRQLISAAAYAVHAVGLALTLYATPLYWKQDYHTSRLSGAEWVDELIKGHPDRIWTELGMRLHVFLALVHELRLLGLKDGRIVGVNEQVAIFLYMCVTGLSVRHVGERFQRANETISKYLLIYFDNSKLKLSKVFHPNTQYTISWFFLHKIGFSALCR